MSNPPTESLPLTMSDGSVVFWEYIPTSPSGLQEVGAGQKLKASFQQLSQSIQAVAQDLHAVYLKARPDKLTVEFGVELSAESGELTALIVKGSGKANLKITLEWQQAPPSPTS